jgi:hypothetical protein
MGGHVAPRRSAQIIGLGYKARSGKDTVARELERYGYRVVAFADALKSGAREMFKLTNAQLYGDQKEAVDPQWGLTPRNILQRLGTEAVRREFGDDFWIRALRRKIHGIEENLGRCERWAITDVRFVNEALAVKSWGGIVVRVDRPGAGASGGVARHASETQLDTWGGWDAVVDNSGTLNDLRARAYALTAQGKGVGGYGCKP